MCKQFLGLTVRIVCSHYLLLICMIDLSVKIFDFSWVNLNAITNENISRTPLLQHFKLTSKLLLKTPNFQLMLKNRTFPLAAVNFFPF
jgi:hypothetical protein